MADDFVHFNTKHGYARSRTTGISKEWISWRSMRQRCNNPNCKSYKNYGGRGIKVCDRWNNSFENFINDMGKCPKGYSIERIDNNKGYNSNNCRWANAKTQSRNKRNNVWILFQNKNYCLSDFSKLLNQHPTLILYYLKQGKSPEEISEYFNNYKKWGNVTGRNLINFRGKTQSISKWSRELNIPLKYLSNHYTRFGEKNLNLIIRKYIVREFNRRKKNAG